MITRELNPVQGFSLSALFGGGLASAWLAAQPADPSGALAVGGLACLTLLGLLVVVRSRTALADLALSESAPRARRAGTRKAS